MSKTGNEDDCEDVVVQSEHFYAVIDGVTSKFPVKYNGKNAGRYCAELLGDAILRLDKDIDCVSAFEHLNDAIKSAYGDVEITIENKMQACAIIYSKSRKEIWCYGDCQLMINNKYYDHSKLIDKVMENLRALSISIYLKEGGSVCDLYENDIGRESILPYLKKQSMFANTDDYFGYSVFDGMGINKNLIKIYKVKAGDHVVLASDGYPKLFDTLKESEEYLKWVLEIDPLSIKENKQTKMIKKGNISFDDRSYLSFTIN